MKRLRVSMNILQYFHVIIISILIYFASKHTHTHKDLKVLRVYIPFS